ncbi:inosine-uridine nucleoside N-ribohydrolase [Granulicella arctica]|uniref:Inosine-uridine nucleoside N-ribohydrolase n=1 Tax=Granulicella arctica TaxID=940613 RepID=A0A7Y9TM44_9BACT|nr:inosine-uridine nucleoside N-ribohydrolase [Granulicella arctica]
MSLSAPLLAQQRYIVVDQDAVGPGGSDMQSILLLLQAPDVKVLGITIVTGDVWADEGVRHTLRALELVGRKDIPVYTGSTHPLVRTQTETKVQHGLYGKAWYEGAYRYSEESAAVLKEGEPTTHAAGEDAVRFLIEMVHRHPHEVTIFAGGPMTNVALAVRSDPHFAETAKELIFMGGSINPATSDPEFAFNPRHEFNFWFDPEAAHIVLTAPWAKITQTTVDISLQAKLAPAAEKKFSQADSPAAKYMQTYGTTSPYMWDELAVLAWLNPAMIRVSDALYVDVNLDHGYAYGDTLTWTEQSRPQGPALQKVQVQRELDSSLLEKDYLSLMSH